MQATDQHRYMHLPLFFFCQHVGSNHVSISYPDVQSREHPRASPPEPALEAALYATHHSNQQNRTALILSQYCAHTQKKKLSPDLFNLKGIVTKRPVSNLLYCKLLRSSACFPRLQLHLRRSAPHRHFHGEQGGEAMQLWGVCPRLTLGQQQAVQAAAVAQEVEESPLTFWRIFTALHFCSAALLPRPCQPHPQHSLRTIRKCDSNQANNIHDGSALAICPKGARLCLFGVSPHPPFL